MKNQFIEDETAFLNAFFQHCQEQGMMREGIEKQTPDAVKIIRHIQNGDILKALTLAYDTAKDEEHKRILTIRLGNYHDLDNRQKKGSIDSRDYTTQLNQIIDALLETINH
jgi:hypothetical protein